MPCEGGGAVALRGRDVWPQTQTHSLSGVYLRLSPLALEVYLKQELMNLGKSPYLSGPVSWPGEFSLYS